MIGPILTNSPVPGPTTIRTTSTKSPDKVNPVLIWAPIVGVIGAILIGLGIFLLIYRHKRRGTEQSNDQFQNYETYGVV